MKDIPYIHEAINLFNGRGEGQTAIMQGDGVIVRVYPEIKT